MVSPVTFSASDLDGEEPGGFVVVNVDAPLPSPYQILEDDNGGYYRTLQEAREAGRRFRAESGNDQIYVYALMGVAEALRHQPEGYMVS